MAVFRAGNSPEQQLRPVLRNLRLGWVVSLLGLAWIGWGAVVNPVRTLEVLAVVCLVLGLVLGGTVLPARGVVRAGYWFFAPRAVTSLHFLPPRELRAARKAKSPAQALRELRSLLADLAAHGVQLLYAETNLPAIARVGFRPLWAATPLTWAFTVMQHRIATGRWNLRWPRLYVYVGDADSKGARARRSRQSVDRRASSSVPSAR